MKYRYNPPPGWPPPPIGWVPPLGWRPPPTWPPAPPGWQFWVLDHSSPYPLNPLPAEHQPPLERVDTHHPIRKQQAHTERAGSRKRLLEVEAENTQLIAEIETLRSEIQDLEKRVADLRGMDAVALDIEVQRARSQLGETQKKAQSTDHQVQERKAFLKKLQDEIVQTEDIAILQEVGIYEYRHRLSDAVAYRSQLEQLTDRIRTMARGGEAVTSSTHWTVNGSAREGQKLARETAKLMLRAYNAEADNCVRAMRPYRLNSCLERLNKARNTIARLGNTMNIRISNSYHQLRLKELELTSDYLVKVEEEKERIRIERQRQREEQALQREIERERAKLAKEDAHWAGVQAQMEANGNIAGVAEANAKRAEIAGALADVEARTANVRTGWVYVISNVGAFGERMIKIGMTRRLDPTERVRELGDASVPFKFDIHALIFSEDAVSLENRLHQELANRRVNQVNLRREFFYATPTEVRMTLERIGGHHLLEYTEHAEAVEWHTSQNISASINTKAAGVVGPAA